MSRQEIIKLSQYTQPVITESKRESWVTYNYKDSKTGKVSSYYQFLIDRFKNSTTNNAAINNIVKLIYSDGLNVKDSVNNLEGFVQVKKLFSKTTLRNVIFDYKALGAGAFQVIWSKDGKSIAETKHLPIQNLLPSKCNKDGIIEGFWYSDNWQNIREFKPYFIPSLSDKKQDDIEVVVFGDYNPNSKYFYSVDYQGCLDYCLLEEKMSEFLVNTATNGFSGTKIINFNTGSLEANQARIEAERVKEEFTGSNGDVLIVAFNDNKEQNVEIQDVPLGDAPEHYSYLATEAESKILAGHNVISSMLIGISKDGQGFSDNGSEIETASLYMMNTVICSKQETIIDALDKILAVNKVFVELFFKRKKAFEQEISTDINVSTTKVLDGINSLSPLVANKVLESMTETEIRQLVGLNANSTPKVTTTTLSIEGIEGIEGYELVDSRAVIYEHETDLNDQVKALNEPTTLQKIINLVKSGIAYPKRKSEQDSDLFLVRYRFSGTATDDSRPLCKMMVNEQKLYRIEDINLMSETYLGDGYVNKEGKTIGWGPEGALTFDRFLYKNGGNCNHFWTRETYRKKGTDLSNPNAQTVTPGQARKEGFIVPANNSKVYQKPADMPYNGFLPTNPRFN